MEGEGGVKVIELVETSDVKEGLGFPVSWKRALKVPTNKRFELLSRGDLCILERYTN